MTLLEAVNRVLRGLREPQVSSFTAEHSLMVVQLVNEAKQDLEDIGPWSALRSTVDVSLADGENSVVVTGTTDRSYLLFDEMNQPMAFVVTEDQECRMQVVPYQHILARRALDFPVQDDIPYLVGFDRSGGQMTAHVYPGSSGTHNLRFVVVIPQEELSTEVDEISIPSEPVWREALVRAMEERGEEFAGPIEAARARAEQAKSNAMLRDFGADPMTFEPM